MPLCILILDLLLDLCADRGASLTDIGYETSFATAVLSVSMIALAWGKAGLGMMSDKIGIENTTYIAKIATIVLYVGLLFSKLRIVLIVVILGMAISNAYDSIGHSLTVTHLYGKNNHSGILGIIAACNSLGGVFCALIAGSVYDMMGSYNLVYVGAMISAVVMLALYWIIFKRIVHKKAQV